jgi:hypothetical protein
MRAWWLPAIFVCTGFSRYFHETYDSLLLLGILSCRISPQHLLKTTFLK